MHYFLGVDIGSVSSNFVLLNKNFEITHKVYMRTQGNPVQAIKDGYAGIKEELGDIGQISGVGSTGSGRNLADMLLGADIVKNEITAHGVAALHLYPNVRTIIEIGGQDSKMILLKDAIVHDFAMNTVCAAGTGSFLDQQASRLNIPIEQFGEKAVMSRHPVRIAGRCGVFAESDMIHKQQMGYSIEDILMGLCEALVRNYLSNVAKGKKIEPPIVFQGGVAANIGLKIAFEKVLGLPIEVAEHHNVMGAVGAAILAKEQVGIMKRTKFKGDKFISEGNFKSNSFECKGCPNLCEVIGIKRDEEILAYWGDRCKKWESSLNSWAEVL
ncbi:MAG TPA: acyl-CoA dehydratase activase [Syntrophomonadaceae bacterium]|nr:acyl-CoA dehydratase activase [Syntrophomonadaceae bacterium]